MKIDLVEHIGTETVVHFGLDTDRLQFFDPETNAGIYDGEAAKRQGKRG